MAITIADLLVRFAADTSSFDAGVSGANQKVGAFQQTTGSMLGSLRTVGGVALGVAGGGLLALGAGMVGVGASGLSLNSSMENVTAQLNAFTKDGAKSAEILDMIRERAAKTPFEFNEMARATAGLLPAAKASGEGLESLVEKAEILAASNPAQGLEGAAFALREAVSGDFTSIIERFNLPRQFINKLKDEGVPALEIVQRAMKEVGFDTDLVANLAETADGRWSTFKDTFQGIAATITKPIFDTFSAGLGNVNGWLDANAPKLNELANIISVTVDTAMYELTQTLGGTGDGLSSLIDTVVNAIEIFAGVTSAVIDFIAEGEELSTRNFGLEGSVADVADSIVTLILNIYDGIRAVMDFIRPIVDAVAQFVTWQDVMVALGVAVASVVIPAIISMVVAMAPIVLTIGGIIAASALLRTAWAEDWGGIREKTAAVWEWLKAAFEAIQTWFNSTFPNGLSDLLAIWLESWTAIQDGFDEVWSAMSEAWQTISDWLTVTLPDALDSLQSSWQSGWESVRDATSTQWSSIRSTFDTIRSWLDTTLPTSVTSFDSAWRTGWENAKTSTSTQWALIQPTLETVKSWMDATLPTAMSGFRDAATTAWESVRSNISSKIDSIIGTFRSMDDWLSGTLRNALNSFKDLLAGMTLNNPFSAMVTALSNLSTALSNAKQTILSWVSWLQNLHIPNPFAGLSLPSWMGGGNSNQSVDASGTGGSLFGGGTGGSGNFTPRLPLPSPGSGFDVDSLAQAIVRAFTQAPPLVRAEFAITVAGTNDVESVTYDIARRVSEIIQRKAT